MWLYRRVAGGGGEWELVPESTNPLIVNPVLVGAGDDWSYTWTNLPKHIGDEDYASVEQQVERPFGEEGEVYAGFEYPAVKNAGVYEYSGKETLLPSENGRPLFTETENLHLTDCSGIIRAMNGYRLFFFGLTALLAGIVLCLCLRKRQAALKDAIPLLCDAFSAASLLLLAAASGLIVWGILDFDSLFIGFHRVFFTNDLWILDPQTDLLIQLMPETFFTAYVRDILFSLAPVLLLMAVFPLLNRRIKAWA